MSRGPPSPAPGPEASGAPEARARTTHWMVRVLERGGLSAQEAVDVPHTISTREAWPLVARMFGVSERRIAEVVAVYFRLVVADLAAADPEAAQLVPGRLAREYLVLPLRNTGRHLVVAACDPIDVERERSLRFLTGKAIVFEVAPPSALAEAVEARYTPEKQVERLLEGLEADMDQADATVKLVEAAGPEQVSEDDIQATPVVKLTNVILRDAISMGASDIHIEPGGAEGVVRYRVDGVLRPHMALPMFVINRIVSRIKVLSRLDIADRLRPQDGKARIRVRGNNYDLRVSTIPARRSEKCVLRVLDSNASVTLDDLGILPYELERIRSLIGHRDGIVVVTGPTGSGKTTTLYGALRELADGKVNIMTVEDPVEYDLPAVTQTQVEVRQGVTFGRALRALLRQDPDVILVGEIRDKETAEVAVQAAMTGHLVLTTVHANDAVSAVSRLTDMGLRSAVIAQTLRGALAQRLIRKVCANCAEPVGEELTPDEQRLGASFGIAPVMRAVGCGDCGSTGYRGRLPVLEVLDVTPRFREAVEQRKGWLTLSRLAIQGGMRPMIAVALDWMAQGRTTLAEVERVLGQQIEEEEEASEAEARGPSRVLLVGSDDRLRLRLSDGFRTAGFHVHEASNGPQALEVLNRDPDFSLIVSSLSLPQMDGRALLEEIRGSVDTAALPVLMLVQADDEKTEAKLEVELLDAGADDCLLESVDAVRLVSRAKALVRRSLL